jgi:hypothetical protein
MAIDRGPWNALVDDDGSNLVGSIWNKDKIKTVILDPTDAAIAAAIAPFVGQVAPWTARPFNAANYAAEPPLTWTPTAAQIPIDRYTYVGNTMFWHFRVNDVTLGGTAGPHIHVKLPGTRLCFVAHQLTGVDGYSNGTYSIHKFFAPASPATDCWIRRVDLGLISPGVFFQEFMLMLEVSP